MLQYNNNFGIDMYDNGDSGSMTAGILSEKL